MKFCVVSCVHNAKNFIKQHLESVKGQKRCEFIHFVIDDASTDGTAAILEEEAKERDETFIVLNKPARTGALHSWRIAMEYIPIEDNDVVVELDGDDWFSHDRVLARIEQEYDEGCLATYGNYRIEYDPEEWNTQIPDHMTTSRCGPKLLDRPVRKQLDGEWRYSAIRTFKKYLFNEIPKSAWNDSRGMPFTHCKDVVYFLPILELIGMENLSFIDEELMVYNYHANNDFVPNGTGCGFAEQDRVARELYLRSPIPKLSDIK